MLQKRKTSKNNHSNWFYKYWIKHYPNKVKGIPRNIIDVPIINDKRGMEQN